MLWKYTWRDCIPLSVTLFQLALNVWIAATWNDRTLLQNLLFLPICVFLFWYNGLVASHNFVHTPWFKSELLNRLYMALNSVNIGLPQIYYRYEHLIHHRYINDRQDSFGQTNDPTSLFAHSKNGEPEPVLSYCALGIFRANLMDSFREINKRGENKQLYFEIATCLLGLIGYFCLSWRYVVFIFIPTFYLGWFLEHLENYYEHFGGTPENRYANSTSYYGYLYNSLFCNEGYHQEHHLRPGVHWTKRQQTRLELQTELDNVNRVILCFPPILAVLDHRRIAQYQRSSLSSVTPEIAIL